MGSNFSGGCTLYTTIIVVVLCVLVGVYVYYRNSEAGYRNVAEGFAITVLGGAFGFLFGLLLSMGIGGTFLQRLVAKETYPLVTYQDNITASGHFFLGSGVIHGEPSFAYYKQEADGGYVFRSISANQAKVYEEDRADAQMQIMEMSFVDERLSPWFTPNNVTRTDFHVPKGTILRVISLDGQ